MEMILGYLKEILVNHKARAGQLAGRLIAKGLMALAGALGVTDPEITGGVGGIAQAIAVAAIALAIFLIDLLIHKLRHGGVVKDVAMGSRQ